MTARNNIFIVYDGRSRFAKMESKRGKEIKVVQASFFVEQSGSIENDKSNRIQ